jgi:tight adherence protein B
MLMIVIIFAIIAFAGVGFVFTGDVDGQAKTLKRAQTIGGVGKAEKVRRANQDVATIRRRQIVQNLKTVDRAQRKQSLNMEARLRQAGLSFSVQAFWVGSGVVGVLFALPALVFTHNALIALGLGFGCGLGLPRWTISILAQRRMKKFTEDFPNATDIIVRGIKSGLPINDCLKVIARESPEPLGSEFGRLVENISVGLTIEQALDKLYARINITAPTYMTQMFTDPRGHIMLAGGAIWMAIGTFVMRRMINFKF